MPDTTIIDEIKDMIKLDEKQIKSRFMTPEQKIEYTQKYNREYMARRKLTDPIFYEQQKESSRKNTLNYDRYKRKNCPEYVEKKRNNSKLYFQAKNDKIKDLESQIESLKIQNVRTSGEIYRI